jgi:hypothetical protein
MDNQEDYGGGENEKLADTSVSDLTIHWKFDSFF